ncbi:MAG: hypothetical protein HKO66_02120 [Saprospiraceae bacterium]|nr:HPF/RaiA family ribosome-associated protein [Bacteroidia bacterium]NNE14694.1 hypothetical protein [Saprospiraceae bacterium]NNL91008.1 hypothetical protein [Saprospiraceae bacterium]
MDIKVNAKAHENQDGLKEYYSLELNKRFAKYVFIKEVILKIKDIKKDGIEVSLELEVENSNKMFAKSVEETEPKAYKSVVSKINRQIEKYKEVHYKSN